MAEIFKSIDPETGRVIYSDTIQPVAGGSQIPTPAPIRSTANGTASQDKATLEKIRALVPPKKDQARIVPAGPRGPIPARKGIGVATLGGGIASPLTETDYLSRTYYDTPQQVKSSDGLFVWLYRAPKQVFMVDANGEPVELIFAEPVQPPDEEEP